MFNFRLPVPMAELEKLSLSLAILYVLSFHCGRAKERLCYVLHVKLFAASVLTKFVCLFLFV